MTQWLVRHGSTEIGPVSTDLLVEGITSGRVPQEAEVQEVGKTEWLPLEAVDEFNDAMMSDDAMTRVTDSPWFDQTKPNARPLTPIPPYEDVDEEENILTRVADQPIAPPAPRPAAGRAPERPRPAAGRPPTGSRLPPLPAPRPAAGAPPAGRDAPAPSLGPAAGLSAYEEDDEEDVKTRVAAPSSGGSANAVGDGARRPVPEIPRAPMPSTRSMRRPPPGAPAPPPPSVPSTPLALVHRSDAPKASAAIPTPIVPPPPPVAGTETPPLPPQGRLPPPPPAPMVQEEAQPGSSGTIVLFVLIIVLVAALGVVLYLLAQR